MQSLFCCYFNFSFLNHSMSLCLNAYLMTPPTDKREALANVGISPRKKIVCYHCLALYLCAVLVSTMKHLV